MARRNRAHRIDPKRFKAGYVPPKPNYKKIILVTGIAPTHLFARELGPQVKRHLEALGHQVELREFPQTFRIRGKDVPWHGVPDHYNRRFFEAETIGLRNKSALVVPLSEHFTAEFMGWLHRFSPKSKRPITEESTQFGWDFSFLNSKSRPESEQFSQFVNSWHGPENVVSINFATPREPIQNSRVLAGHQKRLYLTDVTTHKVFEESLAEIKDEKLRTALSTERKPEDAYPRPRNEKKHVHFRGTYLHRSGFGFNSITGSVKFYGKADIDREDELSLQKDGRRLSNHSLHDLYDGFEKTDLDKVRRILGKEGEELYAKHLALLISRRYRGEKPHPDLQLFEPVTKTHVSLGGGKTYATRRKLSPEEEEHISDN